MNTGAKVVLGLLAVGGITALVFMSGEQKANAAPGGPPVKPPIVPSPPGTTPIPPSGGVVVVPSGAPDFPPLTQPPIVAPPPSSNIPIPGGGSINPGTGTATIPGLGTVTVPPLPGAGAPSAAPGLPSLPIPVPAPTQVLPGLTITPGPAPAPSAPPQSAAEQPTTAPADTIATVSAMLAREQSPHWRIIPEPTLKAWQAARGLVADGDFGMGTALKMAQEIGTLPIIRGWPKGSYLGDGKLENYKASLVQIANSAPEPRRSQLMAASVREQGQGYGKTEKPIATLITLQDA